ncbi:MAG TPA: TonB-dependent receptor [Thermoanaerobaculia bacterium]|nr:TonB-dependent receptor [Thermoanaerobaculia bacterium]
MKQKSIIAFLLFALLATASWAQGNPTAKLSGRVSNDGQPLSGVLVTATSPNVQGARTTTTTANGDYLFPALPAGEYTLTFALEGLETATRTVRLGAAQASVLDASLAVASIAEEIVVTGQLEVISQGSESAVTFSKTLVDELPTGRTVDEIVGLAPGVSTTGPAKDAGTGQASISISGAPSFENLFLINGVVANENLRGQTFPLFIEDAVQETTTSSGSISAEYGRFTGGVVNVITKSGGNQFSGSLRSTLRNQDWTPSVSKDARQQDGAANFTEAAHNDEIVPTYEATLGGPILKDKIWFFGAGRDLNQTTATQTSAPTFVPFDAVGDEQRYEGKLTISPTAKHTIIGSYIKIDRLEEGNFFGVILDERSLVNRELPQELKAYSYSGVLTDRLYVTAQYNERTFQFIGSGAPTQDLIQGTLLLDQSRGNARYWSPTFCGICRPEDRNNKNYLGKLSYFLSTGKAGTHELVGGYDSFDDIRAADNHQSGSDYRVFGTGAIIRGTNIFPVFDSNTVIQFNPIAESTQGTSFKTNSYFANDSWRFNDRLSFNIGFRYDQNDGKNAQGRKVASDSNFSPRLAATWDPKGDGSWIVNASYGKYVAGIANSVADSTSTAGAPATFQWEYDGPPVNLGNPANPADSAAALTTLFNWFNANGGPNGNLPLIGVAIPGGNQVIRGSLNSPNAEEFSLGFSKQFAGRGIVRVTGIHREFSDFYATRGDLTTGTVPNPSNPSSRLDLQFIENNSSAFERKYDALQAQFQWRLIKKLDIGGNWTISELKGNFDGETRNNGPVTGDLTYPEFKVASWNRPNGDLSADQRHKVGLYGVYRLLSSEHQALSLSLFQSYQTGLPYGAFGSALIRANAAAGRPAFDFRPNSGYRTPPSSVGYFFTARDEFRTDNILRTDLSMNYSFRFSKVELFISPEVSNLFNAENLDTTDTRGLDQTVFTAANTGATSCSQGGVGGGPGRCQPFNPYTTTPVEHVNWQKGPNFGKAVGPLGYQNRRTFRISVGFRF